MRSYLEYLASVTHGSFKAQTTIAECRRITSSLLSSPIFSIIVVAVVVGSLVRLLLSFANPSFLSESMTLVYPCRHPPCKAIAPLESKPPFQFHPAYPLEHSSTLSLAVSYLWLITRSYRSLIFYRTDVSIQLFHCHVDTWNCIKFKCALSLALHSFIFLSTTRELKISLFILGSCDALHLHPIAH